MVVEWLKALRELVFPPLCACCQRLLVQGEQTICTACRYDMPITYHFDRRENYVVDVFAGRILFENASALMFFRRQSDYQRLIHRMKYGGRADVAYSLGQIYGRYLSQSKLYGNVELIVPVPLHWSKRISRGYNQSEEFARGIAFAMGLRCESKALRRVRRTRTQARLSDVTSRSNNVRDAFKVVRPQLIEGRVLLLVDDVITTGSTLEACAMAVEWMVPSARLNIGAIAVVARNG